MLQILKSICILVWKSWFFVCLFVLTVVLSPLLIFVTLSEKTYVLFFLIAQVWARMVLFLGGFRIKKQGKMPALQGSKILIANHTSPLDILLMFVLAKKPLVFIGKSSLAKIPIFGFFFKRTSILVDRSNSSSRLQAFKQAKARLERGLDVCIFPEGGVPDDETIVLDTFKNGAFRLSV